MAIASRLAKTNTAFATPFERQTHGILTITRPNGRTIRLWNLSPPRLPRRTIGVQKAVAVESICTTNVPIVALNITGMMILQTNYHSCGLPSVPVSLY